MGNIQTMAGARVSSSERRERNTLDQNGYSYQQESKRRRSQKKSVPRGFTVFNIAQVEKIVTESDLMEAETAEDFTALSLQQLDQICERAAK